jgi:hypothetical protein
VIVDGSDVDSVICDLVSVRRCRDRINDERRGLFPLGELVDADADVGRRNERCCVCGLPSLGKLEGT